MPAEHGLYGLVFDPRELLDHVRNRDQTDTPASRGAGARIQALTSTQRSRLVGLLREVLRSPASYLQPVRLNTVRRELAKPLPTRRSATWPPAGAPSTWAIAATITRHCSAKHLHTPELPLEPPARHPGSARCGPNAALHRPRCRPRRYIEPIGQSFRLC